ncbi:MAG: MarR family transcriptional regulator [Gammaproteobacteria bacterium]|nr:MarR family transcriptional regulator [Gammaproteobacteria bacterium]MDH5728468.1 MarR family transcriptional regulator [Gammaproteobacteria bacterium]
MFERCLYFNANAAVREINRVWDRAYQALGLSPAHAYVLRLLLAKGGMPQRDIAAELSLKKSTITRFVDALSMQDLVRRDYEQTNDRREQIIMPTAKAKHLHKQLDQVGEQLFLQMQKTIGAREIAALVSALREVKNKFE